MSAVSNRMDPNLTGLWVNFFTAAGIPSEVAATYALTFTENRIQNDMLLDLNKEYLRDMGIARMGDIIAILRHAKQVHESTARDRVLSTTAVSNKVPVAAVTGRSTVAQPTSPASRILERYTRNPQIQETSPVRAPQIKRKSIEMSSDDLSIKKARLIRFGSPPQPSKMEKEGSQSKTVFARLGNSEPVKAAPQKVVNKKVFSRLGNKDSEKIPIVPIEKDALKYEGILKSVPPTKKVFTVTTSVNNVRKIAVGTMRADETPVSAKEKLALAKTKSVKFSSHVEYKEIDTSKKGVVPAKQKFSPVFNKPERRLSMPESNNGVKARLGVKDQTKNKFLINRNVFNRLGA
ncbi:uncharacterized protein LOC126771330 [Nymphalis io]|uniref:uncharacterized protein LOC126771330 n=1 Tax=Inachis io TaxID=171585 RepID=UPI0021673A81|nr:uncharacterized protein LOC126771330 [Nymphalis io]